MRINKDAEVCIDMHGYGKHLEGIVRLGMMREGSRRIGVDG